MRTHCCKWAAGLSGRRSLKYQFIVADNHFAPLLSPTVLIKYDSGQIKKEMAADTALEKGVQVNGNIVVPSMRRRSLKKICPEIKHYSSSPLMCNKAQ
jgi:hypothetical protein